MHKRAIKKIHVKQKPVSSVMWIIVTDIGNVSIINPNCTIVQTVWFLLESIEVLQKVAIIHGVQTIVMENS